MLRDSLGHGMIATINEEKVHPVTEKKILDKKDPPSVRETIGTLEGFMQEDLERLAKEDFTEEERAQLKAGESYMQSRFEKITSAFYPTLFYSLAVQYQEVRNNQNLVSSTILFLKKKSVNCI